MRSAEPNRAEVDPIVIHELQESATNLMKKIEMKMG